MADHLTVICRRLGLSNTVILLSMKILKDSTNYFAYLERLKSDIFLSASVFLACEQLNIYISRHLLCSHFGVPECHLDNKMFMRNLNPINYTPFDDIINILMEKAPTTDVELAKKILKKCYEVGIVTKNSPKVGAAGLACYINFLKTNNTNMVKISKLFSVSYPSSKLVFDIINIYFKCEKINLN